jgi:MFS family permease
MSDMSGKRLPFVRLGYLLSAVSKPMMAMFIQPLWVLGSRTVDRVGKGIRTGARDAMLSDEATMETKGRVFGFHRMMDTSGAVLGPALALLYLYYCPEDYRTLFFIAVVPGMLAVLATYLLKEIPKSPKERKERGGAFSFLRYWKESPAEYRRLVIGLLAFTLFNSSDVFLLLKAKEAGLTDTMVIGVYIFYNLVYAIAALPLGIWSDKLGLKRMYMLGLGMFAIVYFGMSVTESLGGVLALFFVYGLYAAATEGISKAWLSNLVPRTETATAIGTYAGFQSIGALLASSITGLIWYQFGGGYAFAITGVVAILVMVYIGYFVKADLKG